MVVLRLIFYIISTLLSLCRRDWILSVGCYHLRQEMMYFPAAQRGLHQLLVAIFGVEVITTTVSEVISTTDSVHHPSMWMVFIPL